MVIVIVLGLALGWFLRENWKLRRKVAKLEDERRELKLERDATSLWQDLRNKSVAAIRYDTLTQWGNTTKERDRAHQVIEMLLSEIEDLETDNQELRRYYAENL